MLGVGLLISTITGRLRQQTDTLRKRQERLRALYKVSRALSQTPEMTQMATVAQKELEEFYKLPVLILMTGPQKELAVSAGDPQLFGWNENEQSVARWVFDKGQIAGAGSDTLAGASGLYLPLKGIRSTVGVLAIRPDEAKSLMDPEQLLLLETFASEIGGAIESTHMSEAIGRAELQMEMQAITHPKSDTRLRLGDFLTENRVVLLPAGLTSDQVFRELLARLSLPNSAQALQAILEREKAGATLITDGVAIPHARLPGLQGLQAALGISQEGPVHVWLLFLGPAEDPKTHLAFLATVSAFFQPKSHVEELLKLKSTKEIVEYIRQSEIPV